MQNDHLSLKRLYLFILRQLTLNIPSLIYAAAAIFGILTFISLLYANINPHGLFKLQPLYSVLFILGGFILTSRILNELNDPKRGYMFFTLPVSTVEKTLGLWLLSSPLYVIFFKAVAILIQLISSTIADTPDYNAFESPSFKLISFYSITQTIFFLGACTFKNNHFFKTLLSLFLIVFGLFVFSSFVMHFLMNGMWEGEFVLNFNESEINFNGIKPFRIFFKLFTYLLAPYLLVLAYYKLKERQV